ncbi:Lycopene cyclase protein [seawater metagenome]|uniref:Lycopene cyclase protein n=1 Tax=seawater metagenome TaxID=1561972 RepID=A0A5E8CHH3_9ZZZZ
MFDIIIIGSGPSSLLMTHYLLTHYQYNICLITKKFLPWHCTYGIFEKSLQNSWLLNDPIMKDIFSHKLDCQLHCPDKNQKLDLNKNIELLQEKYYLLNNNDFFIKINELFLNNKNNNEKKIKSLNLKEGTVLNIINHKDKKKVIYLKNNKKKVLFGKLIIEGTGHLKPIGIRYLLDYPKSYQTFVGYKIETVEPHGFSKVILMDWYDTEIGNCPSSFCYFIPYSKTVLFAEETILCNNSHEKYHKILESRLKKRLDDYKLNIKKVIFIEKNIISMNRFVPDPNSVSLGIGVNGNMVNPVSGYSLGINIYNIPKLAKLINIHQFDTFKIYQDFWNWEKKLMFIINLAGQKMLLSYKTNKQYSIFFKQFISKTNHNKVHFNFIFHNIFDNKLQFLKTLYIYFTLGWRIIIDLILNTGKIIIIFLLNR